MANSKGHSPMYPGYPFHPDSITYRNLYMYEKGQVYDSTGKAKIKIPQDGYNHLVSFLFENNGFLFVSSLSDVKKFPYVGAAVLDSRSQVSCQKSGKATSITIKQGRQGSRKIVPIRTWHDSFKAELNPTFLQHMENLYQYCGVGTHSTPGAVGNALMLQSWYKYQLMRHTAPGMGAQSFLWNHHIGGRCDTPGLGNYYSSAIELDMSSAYLAHFMEHPTGTACPFYTVFGTEHYATFFAEVVVTIREELPLGPFPIRNERTKQIVYPTLPGTYKAFLWKEQIKDCIEAGCLVDVKRGYGWKYFTSDNQAWARDTYKLRLGAYGSQIETDIKSIIVAAIGRHGMRNTFHHLSEKCEGKDAISLPLDKGAPSPYFVVSSKDYNTPAMSHWYSYTIMQCNRSLYRHSLQPAREGRLIMTNYDALLVIEADETFKYAEKHSLEAKMVQAGDLRWQRLTNVKILAPRSLDCDQKTIRPGVALEGRV